LRVLCIPRPRRRAPGPTKTCAFAVPLSMTARAHAEAPLEATTFEDLPGRGQAAALKGEQNRPQLRVVTGEKLVGVRPERGVVFGRAQQPPFRAVWVFVDARNLERRHTRSEGTLRAEHRERSSCVGDVCGSRPALARRGLRASVSVGRGGCPGRGHLRHAGVPRLPTSRPGVSPVSDRSLRAPVSRALPARGGLRRLRPGTRVLATGARPRRLGRGGPLLLRGRAAPGPRPARYERGPARPAIAPRTARPPSTSRRRRGAPGTSR
jgi:hypothetical protein